MFGRRMNVCQRFWNQSLHWSLVASLGNSGLVAPLSVLFPACFSHVVMSSGQGNEIPTGGSSAFQRVGIFT